MTSLLGRTVFISGASGHLGSPIARAMCENGARVIINGRNGSRLHALARDLRCEAACFDVMDIRASREFFAAQNCIDVLINAAATMRPKAWDQAEPPDFDEVYRSSVVGPFEMVRAAQEALKEAVRVNGDASVVNISTMYALVAPDSRIYNEPGQMSPPHYGAAKAGMLQLTRHMASHLGQFGIRVNALCPGPFPKPETVERDSVFADRLAQKTMLRRTGRRDELVGPVMFLASHASSFVTGAVLAVDGGWTAW